MPTEISWKIANLERETADGFVYCCHYTVSANDGTYSSGAYGSLGLERPDSLVPYNQLTEAEVIGWVQEKFGEEKVKEIEAALQDQIDQQRNPTRASGLPWVASTAEVISTEAPAVAG